MWKEKAHVHVKMRLPLLLGITDAALEDILRLLDELAVQVDGVIGDAGRRVVLPEDVLAGLAVVLVHLSGVPLALVTQLLGLGAVAALVRLVRLCIWGRRLVWRA